MAKQETKKRENKKVYRFELDINDPVESKLVDMLGNLTGRYRFSDFMRQLLTMTLASHMTDAQAAMMNYPFSAIMPYQWPAQPAKPAKPAPAKPARKSDETMKRIEATTDSAKDALQHATDAFVSMFG